MVDKQTSSGMYWLCHHGLLLEWCHSYKERADFIRKNKFIAEVLTRLKWFQKVKGKLPKEVVAAAKADNKALAARDDAWDVCFNTRNEGEAYNKARDAYHKACKVYHKKQGAYDKAIKTHLSELNALHKNEQAGCPWDGEILVFTGPPE